jgi:hypothetical protein
VDGSPAGNPFGDGAGSGDASTGAHADAASVDGSHADATKHDAGSGSTSSGSGSSSSSSSGASSSGSGGSSGSTSGSSSSGSSGGSSSGSSSSGSSGSSSSGSSSGGNTQCTFGTPFDGSGSFTWYYFGQGTGQENGYYVTACGYQGTEQSGGGQSAVDTVLNVASSGRARNAYFAAIPSASSGNFDSVDRCGACVEITNGSSVIVATVVDACPRDSNPLCQSAGHLDLSTQAFDALGYTNGDPSGTTWQFVACPVSGNIQARLKSGNLDQLYLTNVVFPIVSLTANGQPATHLSYGAWQLAGGMHAAGATLTITDVEGHTVTGTVPGGGGDLGVQLPSPGACP